MYQGSRYKLVSGTIYSYFYNNYYIKNFFISFFSRNQVMMYILYIYFNSLSHYPANTLALPHYFRKNKND